MWGCVFSVYPFPSWWLREYTYFVLLPSSQWVNSVPPYIRKLQFMYEVVRTSSKCRWNIYRTSSKCRWSIYRTSRKRRGTLRVVHKAERSSPTVIIKPEVWTITLCLGLGHETMVCAVCLSIVLWYIFHIRMEDEDICRLKMAAISVVWAS